MHARSRRGRHSGVWQLLCAAPAVLTSAVLVFVAFGWLGRFALLGLVAWLLIALLLLSPTAERFAVRHVHGCMRPVGLDREWLDWLQSRSEQRCALEPGRFDWYVQQDDQPNAMSVGRRTIAVTSGCLQQLRTGCLSPEQGVGVAMHEVGHHETRGAPGLPTLWLASPWQVTYRALMCLGCRLPFAAAARLLGPVLLVIAFVNIAREDAPREQVVPVLILLVILFLAIVVYPIAASAFSRASEHAADAYAWRLGAGPDLATALSQLTPCRVNRPLSWLLHTHPASDARMQRLSAAPDVVSDSNLSV